MKKKVEDECLEHDPNCENIWCRLRGKEGKEI